MQWWKGKAIATETWIWKIVLVMRWWPLAFYLVSLNYGHVEVSLTINVTNVISLNNEKIGFSPVHQFIECSSISAVHANCQKEHPELWGLCQKDLVIFPPATHRPVSSSQPFLVLYNLFLLNDKLEAEPQNTWIKKKMLYWYQQ